MELPVVVLQDIYYKIILVSALLVKLVTTVHVLHVQYLTALNVTQLTHAKFALTLGCQMSIKLNVFVINYVHFLEATVYASKILLNIIMFAINVHYYIVLPAAKTMYAENVNLLS
jgi:hypothetical protein